METIQKRDAWNKGKLIGQKPPFKPKDILAPLDRSSGGAIRVNTKWLH